MALIDVYGWLSFSLSVSLYLSVSPLFVFLSLCVLFSFSSISSLCVFLSLCISSYASPMPASLPSPVSSLLSPLHVYPSLPVFVVIALRSSLSFSRQHLLHCGVSVSISFKLYHVELMISIMFPIQACRTCPSN